MRILGVDYGNRRIGLAVSDPLGLTAQPLGVYEVRTPREDLEYFHGLVDRYKIVRIVIGHPLSMDGTRGPQALRTEEFAEILRRELGLPVTLWDERLTTKQAYDILRQQNIRQKTGKKYKDQLSAGIILSGYLESLRTEEDR